MSQQQRHNRPQRSLQIRPQACPQRHRGIWLVALGSLGLMIGAIAPPMATSLAQTPSPPPRPRAIAPLIPVPPAAATTAWGQDEQIFGPQGDRAALLRAIDHSRRYLQTDKAAADYSRLVQGKLAGTGITRSRTLRSLERFRQLVVTAKSAAELQAAVNREFVLYQATGKDGQGTVAFTGYFEPVHVASRVPTAEFRYPLFRTPAGLSNWSKPHPTRLELEGADGLQFERGPLKGLAVAWLRDRLEAFLVQVQGSTQLQLTDGSIMTLGYAGNTQYPYTGIGRELVQDGKLTLEELTLARLTQYFQDHPADLDVYLPRNQRFIFFRETFGAAAAGSVGVPVTAERSIATDKTIFPPGALALIATQIPYATKPGNLEQRSVQRFVLDQDTGSAIKGAGRVDVFMGTGTQAGDRAGLINSTGQLYYLLLRQ